MGAPMEIRTNSVVCSRCGKSYGARRGNFPVTHAALYKGSGFLPWCTDCVEKMYSDYLHASGEQRAAVRQMCRKMDLYWNPGIYEQVAQQTARYNIMTTYIMKLNNKRYVGKSYDDTLMEAGALWDDPTAEEPVRPVKKAEPVNDEDIEVPKEVIDRFGPGYTNQGYLELDQRYTYWMNRLSPGVNKEDFGVQALVQQISALEIDINRQRAQGQSVDKSVNVLKGLLDKLMVDPSQKKDEDMETSLANTPMGVWLYRYEKKRPLPELPDDLKANRLLKYVFIWMGHVLKMVGSKAGFTKMYDEEMERLRVQRPDFADDSDEELINESYIANLYEDPSSEEPKAESP